MVKKYRKKPIVVEAVQWNGVNRGEIESFCGYENVEFKIEILKDSTLGMQLIIKTLEGDTVANRGDYIINGICDEFYSCKEEIFEKTYELLPKEE